MWFTNRSLEVRNAYALCVMPSPSPPMQRLILHPLPREIAPTCGSRPRSTGTPSHRPTRAPSGCTKSNTELVQAPLGCTPRWALPMEEPRAMPNIGKHSKA